MKSPRDHALEPLGKAAHDLVAAEATLATGRAFDMVCFHAQQAAEKSLKALLASRDVVYPWEHDMGELVALVKSHFSLTSDLEVALVAMTSYAVQVRYEGAFDPDMEEARAGLETAQRMHALAMDMIGK